MVPILNCIHLHPCLDMTMEQVFLFTFLFFLTLFLFLTVLTKATETKRKKLPPGPWRLPIIGNLHLLNPNKPQQSLVSLSDRYGPLMFLQFGSIPTLIISSSEIVEEVFTTHDATFSSRPPLLVPKILLYNFTGMAFAPYSEHWREARKLAVLELLSLHRIRSFEAVRREEVEKLVATIKDLPVANLSELTLSLSNSMICRAELGDGFRDGGRGGEGGVSIHDIILEMQHLFGSFCVADYFPAMEWVDRLRGIHGKLDKSFQKLDKFFDRVIHEHLKSLEKEDGSKNGGHEQNDFVNTLLVRHKVAVQHGGFLSSLDHVKATLIEIFIAGTDTVAGTITWVMTELIRNPRVMNKLLEELRQITKGNTHRFIQESELEKFEYLKQVIKESLRRRPISPLLIPRETTQPCNIRGYIIPANTRVIVNAAAISMDPKNWERPLEFWPERFDGSKVDFKRQEFDVLPFGSGRRKCPGLYFAMVIVELTLANLLNCFDWSLPDGMKPEDINMDATLGITALKKEALCLVAKPKW